MTREEYIEKVSKSTNQTIVENVNRYINWIFDDLESRTCENCKYSRDTASYKGALDCTKGYATEVIDCGSDWHVDENFGCNEFERKEDV